MFIRPRRATGMADSISVAETPLAASGAAPAAPSRLLQVLGLVVAYQGGDLLRQ